MKIKVVTILILLLSVYVLSGCNYKQELQERRDELMMSIAELAYTSCEIGKSKEETMKEISKYHIK